MEKYDFGLNLWESLYPIKHDNYGQINDSHHEMSPTQQQQAKRGGQSEIFYLPVLLKFVIIAILKLIIAS